MKIDKLALKEQYFFTVSSYLSKEDAISETESYFSNIEKLYNKSGNTSKPILGNDTYRYRVNHLPNHFLADLESTIEIYKSGKWVLFMKFEYWFDCEKAVKRLELGGNNVIKF